MSHGLEEDGELELAPNGWCKSKNLNNGNCNECSCLDKLTNLLQRFVLVLGRHDEVIHGRVSISTHATKQIIARP